MIFLFFLPTDQLQVLKLICRHLYKALRGCKHVLNQVMLVLNSCALTEFWQIPKLLLHILIQDLLVARY